MNRARYDIQLQATDFIFLPLKSLQVEMAQGQKPSVLHAPHVLTPEPSCRGILPSQAFSKLFLQRDIVEKSMKHWDTNSTSKHMAIILTIFCKGATLSRTKRKCIWLLQIHNRRIITVGVRVDVAYIQFTFRKHSSIVDSISLGPNSFKNWL